MAITNKNHLRKMGTPMRTERSLLRKASRLAFTGWMVLVGSCATISYYGIPKPAREEAVRCVGDLNDSDDEYLRSCLKDVATKKSTDPATKQKIIDYLGKLLRHGNFHEQDDAMNKLTKIALSEESGPLEQIRVVKHISKILTLEWLGVSYPDICSSERDLQLMAARNLLYIALDKNVDRRVRERVVVLLELPWDNKKCENLQAGRYYMRSMSDVEFNERILAILDRAAASAYTSYELQHFAVDYITELGAKDETNSAHKERIFDVLDRVWTKTGYTCSRDFCDTVPYSMAKVAASEKGESKDKVRMLDVLDKISGKPECPFYVFGLYAMICMSSNTSPEMKDRIITRIESLSHDSSLEWLHFEMINKLNDILQSDSSFRKRILGIYVYLMEKGPKKTQDSAAFYFCLNYKNNENIGNEIVARAFARLKVLFETSETYRKSTIIEMLEKSLPDMSLTPGFRNEVAAWLDSHKRQ